MESRIISKIVGIQPIGIRIWWKWLKKTPFSLKWFCVVMLMKPILDAFYFVKDSGILSPAQIVGFLTFILCLTFIFSKKQKFNKADYLLLIFGFLLFLNSVLVYLMDFSLAGFGDFIRIIVPVLIYFYLKNEIKSLDDVNGFLMTFLFSSIFPYTIYLYEFFFAPIRIEEISIGRGGGLRLTGIYADIFNYISYFIGNLVIFTLYFTNDAFIRIKPNFFKLSVIVFLTIIGLIGIKHQASWGVFASTILIFLFFNIGNKYGKSLVVGMALCLFVSSTYLWNNVISPLYSKEINVYEGNSEKDRALNGRIIRWKKYFTIWDEMPIQAKVFGVGFSNSNARGVMMSGGMHSDYIRFLFSTGVFGVFIYLLFYIAILFSIWRHAKPVRFLAIISVSIILLFAISSNPFGSSGALLYLILFAFVLCSKPKSFFVK